MTRERERERATVAGLIANCDRQLAVGGQWRSGCSVGHERIKHLNRNGWERKVAFGKGQDRK